MPSFNTIVGAGLIVVRTRGGGGLSSSADSEAASGRRTVVLRPEAACGGRRFGQPIRSADRFAQDAEDPDEPAPASSSPEVESSPPDVGNVSVSTPSKVNFASLPSPSMSTLIV